MLYTSDIYNVGTNTINTPIPSTDERRVAPWGPGRRGVQLARLKTVLTG
jgi:hypothetical protein